ncbi:MAG TPA: hypothetical protein VII92_18875, partial [Anaerolineae bacterium]
MKSRWLRLRSIANRLVEVHHPDPDVARRGRLLNVMLWAIIGATILYNLASAVTGPSSQPGPGDIYLLALGIVVVVLLLGVYGINRFVSPRMAAALFIAVVILIVPFSDDPMQVIAGRTEKLYLLPIIVS